MSQLRSLLSKAKSQVLLARVGGGESGGRRAFSFKQFREDVSKKLNEISDPKEPKMLDMGAATRELAVGFDKDLKIILEKLPPKRQSMMFFATMPMPFGIRKLTQKHLKDPLVPYMHGQSRSISSLGHSREPQPFG